MQYKILGNGNFDNICDSQAYKDVKEYLNYLISHQGLDILDIKVTLYGTVRNPEFNFFRKKGLFSFLGKSKVNSKAPNGYEQAPYVTIPLGSTRIDSLDYTTHLNAAKSANSSFGDCHEVYFAITFKETNRTNEEIRSYFKRYRRKNSIRIYITSSIAGQDISNLSNYKDLEGNKITNKDIAVYISIDDPTSNLLSFPLIEEQAA
ncbi:hypothetical protein HON03_00330 [archaeon]|nr:hypothetical protein [archaeon]MBT5287562.1 hypothetical protein [archaeon]